MCWNWPINAQNLFPNEALLCGSKVSLRMHLFHKIARTFYEIWWFFIKFIKSMPAIVIFTASRGPQNVKNSMCAQIVCWIWPTHAPNPFQNEALLCGSDVLFRRHVFLQIDQQFYKIWLCFMKFAKFLPAIVISTAPRSHNMWKTQRLHRLCVEIGPPMPKTYFKKRRCCADLFFASEEPVS